MIQINKSLTVIKWWGPSLDLKTSFPWKNRIRSLRRINPSGAGYVSFNPSRPANSLNSIEPGDTITLDATGINTSQPSSFFEVDNGVQKYLPRYDTFEYLYNETNKAQSIDYEPFTCSTRIFFDMPFGGYGIVRVSINGGPFMFGDDANRLIDAMPESTLQSTGYTVQVRINWPAHGDAQGLIIIVQPYYNIG